MTDRDLDRIGEAFFEGAWRDRWETEPEVEEPREICRCGNERPPGLPACPTCLMIGE